ncbi:MAG: hypothetical protein LIP00_08960 [Parabacteroides sp.]|nr:hypothetical protein [Parabacteroides sp.]
MQATKLQRAVLGMVVFFLIGTWLAGAATPDVPARSAKKKEFVHTFPAGQATEIQIDNRFGNIVVEHWPKDGVEMRVVIESKADNEQTAEKNLQKVSVDVTSDKSRIKAITRTDKFEQHDKERVTVNYTLLVPAYVRLSLMQKFGNIDVSGTHAGESALSVKFGNIAGENFTAPLAVNSEFSNVQLGNLADAVFKLRHSGKVVIGAASQVKADSQFSNLKTGAVQSIQLTVRHGGGEIASCKKLGLDAQFSNVSVARLAESAEVQALAHSNLDVSEVATGFSRIKVKTNFGNTKLKLAPETSFSLKAHASFGNV